VFLYRTVVGASAEAIDQAVRGMVIELRTMQEVFMRCQSERGWDAERIRLAVTAAEITLLGPGCLAMRAEAKRARVEGRSHA
jgi:hypothetical protein